jgi:two-component system, LytTR family, response regulator
MRALIVDDERIARLELRRLLKGHAAIEVAGEARSAGEALSLVDHLRPDVLFLDIHMPGLDVFDFLGQLEILPQIIFTTAYDSFALKAFDAGAVDYLVKPVAANRLSAAIGKLRPATPSTRIEQVFVKDNDRCWLVRVSDICLLESEGNYTRLYFKNERPLIPRSLSALESRLDPQVFFRAGRQHIVNLKSIESVEGGTGGGLLVYLKGNLRIEMSRRQSALFRQAFGW